MVQPSSLIRYSFRLMLFVGVLLGSQAVLRIFIFRPALPEVVQYARDAITSGADTIVFGDSIMSVGCEADSGETCLGKLLKDGLKEKKVFVVNHPSYAGEMVSAFSYFFKKSNFQPALVVVPINLRSFSTGFDQRPGWQFVREQTELRYGVSPLLTAFTFPLFIFKGINLTPITMHDWQMQKVYDGDRVVGTVKDFNDESVPPIEDGFIKQKFIWNYMAALKPEHRKVKALKEAVSYYDSARTKTLFYVSPIDMATGERLIGSRFKSQIAQNIGVLSRMAHETGSDFLDLSSTVEFEGFMWPNEKSVSEHLNQLGRDHTAKQILAYLRNQPSTRALAGAGPQ